MPKEFKLLIVDDMHESIHQLLSDAGVTYSYMPDIKKNEIPGILKEYDGIFVRSKIKLLEEVLKQAPKLKIIGRAGSGLDNIAVDTAKEMGITILNSPEGNCDAVAEHTLGLILALFNKLIKADREVRTYDWQREQNRGEELHGKTVGLLGYGFMGKATAKRLSSFGCEVLAYDKFKSNYGDKHAKESSMEEIYKQADVLSLHIPLIEENYFIIDEQFYTQFSKPIWLINTSRGAVLRLKDLYNAIQKGQIKGAALDVLENEKFHKLNKKETKELDKLFKLDNVLFTPHIAGWTFESYHKINQVLVSKLKDALSEITK